MSTHPDLKFNTPTWRVERDPEYNLLVEPKRVARGGTWGFSADDSERPANIGRSFRGNRGSGLGLRLVRDIMTAEVAK